MGTVTFLTPPFRDQHIARLPAGGLRTLLGLARRFNVALACRCRRGQCGACAVKVAQTQRERGRSVRLSTEEKEVLFRAGKLTRAQYEARELPAQEPLWRLACQYVVRDEDILVAC